MKRSFQDLGVPSRLAAALADAGAVSPFPIQTATIPPALAGRDLCGRAPTGSGKTLAFAVPLAARAGRAEPHRPTALVLTPTRELAGQIRDAIQPLAKVTSRRVATFYGGTNIRRDIDQLRRGVDIAVATPGRLADLINRRDIFLTDVDIVVVDEADRMADMGFLPEVRRLLDQTSPTRQTLLFSATLDGDVDVLVRNYQRDPVRHEVAVDETDGAMQGHVNHLFWPTERTERRHLTAEIVRRVGPAIVFTRTKRGADRLARQLGKDGIATAAIHGDRSQSQRERALSQFARGTVTTLVATDVAARGIHIDDVGIVLHYDLAGSDKDYLHRSGRTGRAGARGLVVTLVNDDQHRDLDDIQRALDMPRGMHTIELAHLTADEVPTPDQARTSRPAGSKPRQRANGNGNGKRHGGSKASPRHNRRGGSGNSGRNNGHGAKPSHNAKSSRGGSGNAPAVNARSRARRSRARNTR